MKIIIFLCGIYSVAFAVFHIFFWRIFNWKTELKKLNFLNRAIMQIFTLRLIYFFCFVALVYFFYPTELRTTSLGKVFMSGTFLFILGRTVEQFIFFRLNNKFSYIFAFILIFGTILYSLPILF